MSTPSQLSTASARAQASAPPLLAVERVSKVYGGNGESVPALRDVTLELPAGRFAALIGRSGCGKSTLLNIAGALDVPTSGRVLLDGICTTGLGEAGLNAIRRGKVGFVFQSFQLLNTLSAVENVELPLLLAGQANPRPAALAQLAAVGLDGLAQRLPHQLSGGQMQRVAIARALVHNPRLLLADEPTGNLDTTTGNAILDLLRRIATEQHVAILMATHSAEAAAYADHILHMRDGRIEQIAAP